MLEPTVADVGRALDQETMLLGEDSASAVLDDALHWIHVYTDLLQFTGSMILASERASEGLSFAARVNAEVERNLLRAHEARYRQRSAFWCGRAADLSDAALVN